MNPVKALQDHGQSVWLDFLARGFIARGELKKLIDEEDPSRPLTDEQITRILQSQGIQVTRRTVAKYREDMRIPSTHQRRVKK